MKTMCPDCHTKFRVSEEYEGKKVKCPKCKSPFVIYRLSQEEDIRDSKKKEQVAVPAISAPESSNATKRCFSIPAFILGVIIIIFGIANVFHKQSSQMIEPDLLQTCGDWGWKIGCILTGVCFIIRSFWPGLTGWRVVYILLGAPIGAVGLSLFIAGVVLVIRTGKAGSAFAGWTIGCGIFIGLSIMFLKAAFKTGKDDG